MGGLLAAQHSYHTTGKISLSTEKLYKRSKSAICTILTVYLYETCRIEKPTKMWYFIDTRGDTNVQVNFKMM